MRIVAAFIFIFFFAAQSIPADSGFPFRGTVKSNGINIRADSRINSSVICKADKGSCLEVVSSSYDWYKIKLPVNASVYIRKDMVGVATEGPAGPPSEGTIVQDKMAMAKVIKDNVNLRLSPQEASLILGQVKKDDIIFVIEEEQGWYKIRPPTESFGWIHKNFIEEKCDNPGVSDEE